MAVLYKMIRARVGCKPRAHAGIIVRWRARSAESLKALLPSWRVYEDENTVAFLDKAQVTRGHTLVVPRRHAEDISALSEEFRPPWRTTSPSQEQLRDVQQQIVQE